MFDIYNPTVFKQLYAMPDADTTPTTFTPEWDTTANAPTWDTGSNVGVATVG